MPGTVKEIDHGWGRIKGEIAKMKGSFVKVGVLSDAGTYEDGGKANLADVATWNEFGTSTIPARPFMAQTYDKNFESVKKFIQTQKDNIYAGKVDVEGALNLMGVFYVAKVKETFTSGDFVENAPSTKADKLKKSMRSGSGLEGTGRPLIDTGQLRASIDYEVEVK